MSVLPALPAISRYAHLRYRNVPAPRITVDINLPAANDLVFLGGRCDQGFHSQIGDNFKVIRIIGRPRRDGVRWQAVIEAGHFLAIMDAGADPDPMQPFLPG